MKGIHSPAHRVAAVGVRALLPLLCFAAGIAAAALPPTGAGQLDPTFGTGGKTLFDVVEGSDDDGIGSGVMQPDGKLVVSGYAERPGAEGHIFAARINVDGTRDATFGTNGIAFLTIDERSYADSFGPALGADGRIFIAGGALSNGAYRCVVVALRANGTLDPTFAAGGVFRYPATGGPGSGCINIAVQADGKIVALGNTDGFKSNFVLRLTPGGALDPAFGSQGVATLPGPSPDFVYGIGVAPSGAIWAVGGPAGGTTPGYVFRLTSAGVPDATFAGGGVFTTSQLNAFFYDVAPLADGSAIAVGYRADKHLVLKLTPAGAPDPAFGAGGVRELTIGSGYVIASIEVQRDGKLLLGVRQNNVAGHWRYAVARLTANGDLDPTFATGGIAQINFGTQDEVLLGIALAPDGKVWAFGRGDIGSNNSAVAIARLLGDEITTPIVEFRNGILDHYFITADPIEAAAVDGGAAGPGWQRTGLSFRSGGPQKAGRFYGNPDLDPVTLQRRGPNSHFYSIEPDEVAQVKRDPGWRFESYDFNAWPQGLGGCPETTQGVRRAYNNRFAQNDSNHRYTTSADVYAQMLAAGWSGEGVVFCAAP
jgi:uncharacterized delta-60 repeat protein